MSGMKFCPGLYAAGTPPRPDHRCLPTGEVGQGMFCDRNDLPLPDFRLGQKAETVAGNIKGDTFADLLCIFVDVELKIGENPAATGLPFRLPRCLHGLLPQITAALFAARLKGSIIIIAYSVPD